MKNKSEKRIKWIYLLGIIPFFTGCAMGPPPPPPVFPGFEWLIIGLMVFIGIFLWKKFDSSEPLKTHYLTEVLNAINQRLKILEKKIDNLEETNEKKDEKKRENNSN